MTRRASSSTSVAVVRANRSRQQLGRAACLLSRWAPLSALIGTTAYALTAHPVFVIASTYGYYWRP